MAKPYPVFGGELLTAYVNNAAFKAALVTSAFVPNLSTQLTYADIQAFEISGGDYIAGGVALDAYGNSASFEPFIGFIDSDDDPTWANLDAADIGGVVFYDSANQNVLVAVDMYSAPVDASGGVAFTHVLSETGFVQLSIPA